MGGMQRGPFVIHSKHGPFQLTCWTLPHASVNLPVINAEEDTISPPSGIMVTTGNFVIYSVSESSTRKWWWGRRTCGLLRGLDGTINPPLCTRVLLERRSVVPLLFGVGKDDPARVTEKRRHVSEQITNINQSLQDVSMKELWWAE